ncbi:PepSY-like domain-containing protein [Calothrix sp. UHCC 0171]|uniref:PepSY-like domain-containing protein n=1 Tax=Calothrix sp. UHCC 0171 TaxID=3110245 RepID=UPI002B20FC53|nr:PepSY-like domain-containing protein [Calothrix sp. UHCC 0171]MEA5573050.1 PepSY-like domain-containing protein [Calothrix sp. UHCC 0171]
MKVIIVGICNVSLLIFLAACHCCKKQEKKIIVPIVVEQAFTAKYSEIPHTWQIHDYGYEAVFTQNGIEYEAEFSGTGEWLESEYLVSEKEFPAVVLEKIKKEYPKFIITKYEIEITPQGLFYEADITDGEREYEVYFDGKGNSVVDLYED